MSKNMVREIVRKLRESVSKEECYTCECFQGLLIQLEMDASEDVHDIIEHLKIPANKMHQCLGCDPCPGGNLFADYLRCKND